MAPRYYSITAYGLTGQTFPKFNDSYLTLAQARAAALGQVKDGYRFVEVKHEDAKRTGYFGVSRTLVETHGVA